jgi:hypothetical protein
MNTWRQMIEVRGKGVLSRTATLNRRDVQIQ